MNLASVALGLSLASFCNAQNLNAPEYLLTCISVPIDASASNPGIMTNRIVKSKRMACILTKRGRHYDHCTQMFASLTVITNFISKGSI